MSTLGERIKEARAVMNWSQQTLADRLGASKSAICLYEWNRRRPMEAVLMSIASATSVNYQWLKTGDGDKQGESVDIRSVEDERILNGLTDKDRAVILRYIELEAPDRRNIRARLNIWIDKIEARYAEDEEQEEGN